MKSFRASQVVDAPLPILWQRLGTVSDWPSWLPTVTAVEPLDAGGIEVGARFRIVQPKLRPAIWTVDDVQAGRSFVWTSASPGLRTRAAHSLTQLPAGVMVELQITLSGAASPLVGLIAGELISEYLSIEALSLKSACEAPVKGDV